MYNEIANKCRKTYFLKIIRKVQENFNYIEINPVKIKSIEYTDENRTKQKYSLTPEDNYCIIKLKLKLNDKGKLYLFLDKNGYLYPAEYVTYYCKACNKIDRKRVDHFLENYPNKVFCKSCNMNIYWNHYVPGITQFIDLPRTKSLLQIKEVLINDKWMIINNVNELSWKIVKTKEKKSTPKLFYQDTIVDSIKCICAECGTELQYSFIKMKKLFHCTICLNKQKASFDLLPDNKGEDMSDSSIIEVRIKKDKTWYKVTKEEIQIKTFEIRHNRPCRHLIYKGLICDKLKYKCKKCGKEEIVSWAKFKLEKFPYLCNHCILAVPEMKEKLRTSKRRPDIIMKTVLNRRKAQLRNISKPQNIVTDYIYNLINTYQIQNGIIPYVNCIKEYPIAVCKEDISYMIIDIAFPQLKIAIEVLGSYWHKPWISYLKDSISMDVLIESYKNNKHFSYSLRKDYLHNKELLERGWKIIYITESEVNDECYKTIIDSLIKENELWKYPLNEDDIKLLEKEKLIEKDLKDNKNE